MAKSEVEDEPFQTDVESFINNIVENNLPATKQHLDAYKNAQEHDSVCQQVRQYCQQIPEETEVWITTEDPPIQGRVIGPAGPPRSYIVETPTGQMHRNREHLNVIPESVLGQEHQNDSDETPVVELPPQAQLTPKIMTRSRTGTIIRPPDRLS